MTKSYRHRASLGCATLHDATMLGAAQYCVLLVGAAYTGRLTDPKAGWRHIVRMSAQQRISALQLSIVRPNCGLLCKANTYKPVHLGGSAAVLPLLLATTKQADGPHNYE